MSNNFPENETDDLIVEQAENDNAWEKAIFVDRKKAFLIILSESPEIVADPDILGGEPVFAEHVFPSRRYSIISK